MPEAVLAVARKGHPDLEFHFWSAARGIWTKHLVFRMSGARLVCRIRHNDLFKKWLVGTLKTPISTIEEARELLLVQGNALCKTPGSGWRQGPPPRGEGTCPSFEALRRVINGDENAPTPCPDGCEVEPDGKCLHGFTAWTRLVGIV